MLNNKTFLAIIPARGGSKRLPNKNILELNGKPLIVYTIESAIKSKYIDKIIVSSDSEEILNISKKNKVSILKRPQELASNTSSTFDAIEHTIKNQDKYYDYIIILQPTSPLRDNNSIDESIEFLFAKKADAIISVCKAEHSPLWANTLPKDQNMANFLLDKNNKRSQDLNVYFRLNGAIYICDTNKYLYERSAFLKNNLFAFVMKQEVSIDIDTKLDFLLCEAILKQQD